MGQKLNSIQFLRAIAAIMVVYVHSIDLQMRYGISWQQNFKHLQNFGAIGVDLFFIVSGFIISFVAHKYLGTEQGIQFLLKRFWRINPMYYITSLLFCAIIIITQLLVYQINPITFDIFLNSFIDTLLIVPNSGTYMPLLLIGWSLSFEWLFYFIFFILIVVNNKKKHLALLILVIALVFIGYLSAFTDYRLIFLTNPILLEFLLGVTICWLYQKFKTISSIISTISLMIGVFSYTYLVINGYGDISEIENILNGHESFRRFYIWGIPSAFFAAGCIFLEKNLLIKKLWNNKIVCLVGDASYSIYLVHLTILSLFDLLYKKMGFFLDADLAIILHVCIAIIAAIGFYKLIEKPLLQRTASKFILISNSIATSIPDTPNASGP